MPEAPILVLNAGSSSLKYRLFGSKGDAALGVIEGIGHSDDVPDHAAALERVLGQLSIPTRGSLVAAIGHRVVHGGPDMVEPVRIDDRVERTVEEMSVFAPVHNPSALRIIREARRRFPDVPQVAVFDTAFHATLPEAARTYAIDRAVATRHGIRRFGFHGISVQHVVTETARLVERPSEELNLIVLHLGNGASATAVERGHSVDTSMGMTPLEGLVMGNRAGDLDPAITFHLARNGWRLDDIEALYETGSGLAGLCGDNDMRSVTGRADAGDPAAELAVAVYCRGIRKYVGAYLAVLGHVDAIAFTGGVGENAVGIRTRALSGLEGFGIAVDAGRNSSGTGARVISARSSRIRVCVVPADEETAIAGEVKRLLGALC
jgi:acetate kinase